MAIRIRKIGSTTIALCAAISEPKDGDIYLDDTIHHALSTKFVCDFESEGLIDKEVADRVVEEGLVKLMKIEQGGKLV